MSDPISFREYDLNLVASMDESIGVPDADMPFRVAILGDFSGRASRSVEAGSLRNRSLIEVDRDNLDEVIQGMGVELNLRLWSDDSPPVVIRFAGLEDFHPDSIFERLDVFQVLRQTRQKLNHPSIFASAAAEVRSWGDPDLVAPRE